MGGGLSYTGSGGWGGGANLHVTPGLGPLPILAMMPGSDQHYKHYNVELL